MFPAEAGLPVILWRDCCTPGNMRFSFYIKLCAILPKFPKKFDRRLCLMILRTDYGIMQKKQNMFGIVTRNTKDYKIKDVVIQTSKEFVKINRELFTKEERKNG
jgi:hypothetical protein